MKKILFAILILIGILVVTFYIYSNYKRGKFLPKIGFSMISSPQLDDIISACLGFKIDSETRDNYKQIIIEKQTDYETFKDKIKNNKSDFCKNISFPQIDFSSQTLIGTEAAAWCRAHIERDLRRDDDNKIYRYIVEEKLNCIPFIGCVARSCTYRHSLNLATIPKLPAGYNLRFEFYNAKH